MKIFNFIKNGIKGAWFYFWGNLFTLFYYDRKYLRGKWFSGKLNGMCSKGWEWTAKAGYNRFVHGTNKKTTFPVSSNIIVTNGNNVSFHPDDLNNFQSYGIYFQAFGKISIGHGTYIAPNVGLITANHDISNLDNHLSPKPITIGEKCWIGMNSVILPGVTLGDNTIVGAGSVVTKSYPDGNCVIAGNPARIIKFINHD